MPIPFILWGTVALIGIASTLTGCSRKKQETPPQPSARQTPLDEFKSQVSKNCMLSVGKQAWPPLGHDGVHNMDRAKLIQSNFSDQLKNIYTHTGPANSVRGAWALPKALVVYFSISDAKDCDTLVPVLELLDEVKADHPNTKINIFEVPKYPKEQSDSDGERGVSLFAGTEQIPSDYKKPPYRTWK